MTSCLQYMRFPVTVITTGLGILFAITLSMSQAQLQCRTDEICEMPNTEAISTEASTFIPRKFIHPANCAGVCSQYAECIAVTYDSTIDICELHRDCEDPPCIALSTKNSSTVAMIKKPGIACPKVRRKVI